jgi:methionyl-tRNA formyltransferase
LRVSFLCSDADHPVNRYLKGWIAQSRNLHDISLVRKSGELVGGDFLFLVSCAEIISAEIRSRYRFVLVLHASPLPRGRGWSPHIWAIINGAEALTVSLLEAEDGVDSGRIWRQVTFPVPRHALWDEINAVLFQHEIELIAFALENWCSVVPREQERNAETNYYPRRKPEDSELDPQQSIASQFDLIRVCDPDRYPAFFRLRGENYRLRIEKFDG